MKELAREEEEEKDETKSGRRIEFWSIAVESREVVRSFLPIVERCSVNNN